MLGQAIVAAGRHAPGRRVVSASMVFTRAADAAAPLRGRARRAVDRRRTFTALGPGRQGGRICATGTLLLDVTAPDVIRHADPAARRARARTRATPFDMSVTGRDLRIVDGAYTGDPDAPVGPPVLDAWVRFRDVPDDPPLHAGLLAQFTGHMSIAAALRPHAGIGQDQAHRTLSTASTPSRYRFHADVRADQWMLYHHRSTFAGDGMTHAECRVHDEDGALLASFTVDAMVRAFADPASDPSTTRGRRCEPRRPGRGPLSPQPGGRFSPPCRAGVVYVEPYPRRVRASSTDGRVIDTERARSLVHRPVAPPTYAFPADEVDGLPAEPEPTAPGLRAGRRGTRSSLVRGGGSRSSTTRRTRTTGSTASAPAAACGSRSPATSLVDTDDTIGVFETSLVPEALRRAGPGPHRPPAPSPTTTYCPYKGTATYWSAAVGDARRRGRRLELRGPAAREPPDRRPARIRRLGGDRAARTC